MRNHKLVGTLRLSLLISLGITLSGCGGTAESTPDESAGGTSGGASSSACTSPQTDNAGLVTCAEGYTHRPQPAQCEPVAEPAAPSTVDCSALENGYLGALAGSGIPICRSGCVVDADCGEGMACACGSSRSPTGGECVSSDCWSDADCDGRLCASTLNGCGGPAFACQREGDQCMTDDDCDGGQCAAINGGRTCVNFVGAACGRPFLVDAKLRTAPVVASAAWSRDRLDPSVGHLSPGERRALAEHWTRMGQMEHASIAAFARFSLQLLSLGAPPELVEACTQALADETAHTKLCFGLASAYAGRAIGPGPLDVTGSLETTSLGDIVDLVIAEGCFGETSAALEALEAAEAASDPVIVAAYSQIARDEQRHAELAFRFVRWALERDASAVTPRLALATAPGGLAVQSIVAPCLNALLNNASTINTPDCSLPGADNPASLNLAV